MQTVKNLFIATILILSGGALQIAAQNQQQPYIDTQASVQREVTPDELYLTITIKESDYKGKKSLEDMQQAMIGVLKQNRIDVIECLTLDFMGSSVDFKIFSRRMVPKSEATYRLKLSDATIMQQVIYGLEAVGISNIELSETKYTKADQLNIELGIEAMKKAQAQAAALAGAIGQQAGKAITISSWASQNNSTPRMYKNRQALLEESSDSWQPINVSKMTYTVNVSVRFELQ